MSTFSFPCTSTNPQLTALWVVIGYDPVLNRPFMVIEPNGEDDFEDECEPLYSNLSDDSVPSDRGEALDHFIRVLGRFKIMAPEGLKELVLISATTKFNFELELAEVSLDLFPR